MNECRQYQTAHNIKLRMISNCTAASWQLGSHVLHSVHGYRMNMRGHVLHSVDRYGMNIMPLALACGAVFWAADYLRLPGVLPYPRRAVCEDRRCGPSRCSGEPHILA